MTGYRGVHQIREHARALGINPEADASSETPQGWAYNPSSWKQRIPLVVIALIGFGVAGWMGLHQLKLTGPVPEPFFGDGTETVLTSEISYLLPIPDAVLGALGYLADAVFGALGGTDRWKRMPWVVVVFAIAVIPFGVISLTLFVLQPAMYASWCTLCQISVALSLAMVPYAWDEFVASWQWMLGRRDAGQGWWGALLGR